MPTILATAAFLLLASDALNIQLSILPGLSVKNLLTYMVAVLIATRMVLSRDSIVVQGSLQGAFLVQIFYAVLTMLVAVFIIEYPRYSLIDSTLKLKATLIEQFIFFVVFLFGARTADDALRVIKGLLLGALAVNLVAILDGFGVIDLGLRVRDDGRIGGAIGESNQYAAFLVMFLPGYIACAVSAHGIRRLFWLGAAFVCAFALVMTASRGGFVGLAMSAAAGAYLYRHLISYSRAAGWAFFLLVLLVAFIALSPYGGLLAERMIGQTTSTDAFDASSGRSEIWTNLLAVMIEHPVTFLTGFGWDVYWSMPFYFSPHNHYLALWFNMGLVGLFAGTWLLFTVIARARRASTVAKPPYRGQLIAFVLGAIGVCTAIFFVDLYTPWYYFWMYGGLVMRLALCVKQEQATAPEILAHAQPTVRRDSYGWAQPGARS